MITVVAALIEKNGKYLIARRSTGSEDVMGKWEFPGGKVEMNETHEQTIIREIQEELDSLVEPLDYIGAFNYEYTNLDPFDDFSITLYAYKCKLLKGNLVLTEHINKKWASKEELLKLDFAPADKDLIKILVK